MSKALTDKMPGLTRDRKEQITTILGYPIRLVDTAGVEKLPKDPHRFKPTQIKQKMMDQTVQALIYSDLTLFVLDARQGITARDKELAKWLKRRLLQDKSEENVKKMNENATDLDKDIFIKKLILLANKADNETTIEDSNIMNDVYKLGLGDPLFVSAHQGDGLIDLLRRIDEEVPQDFKDNFLLKKQRRLERFQKIRITQREEILELMRSKELPDDIDITAWEREFDKANPDPENNSDLDSDNEFDPVETLQNTKDDLLKEDKGVTSQNDKKKKPIQISIIGRSNCGKSTLVNSLLQEERVIADDLAGTTRDAIKVQWVYRGRKIDLVDTSGIDKKITKVSEVEKKIQNDTIRAVKQSHVVVCMIDALRAFQSQDLSLAQYVCDQGRALILVVNKWDLVPEEYKKKALRYMNNQLEKHLAQVRGVYLHCMSAKNNGNDKEEMMNYVLKAYEKWNIRISTGMLNDWLNRFKKVQNAPTEGGNRLKIRFVSQVKSRPPTFVVFVNDKVLFKPNYMRFMRQKMAEEFGLDGTPLRFIVRETDQKVKNPKKLSEKYIEHIRMKKVVSRYKRTLKIAKEKLSKFNFNKTK
ncbi:hypothetical protein ABPG74_012478 [Tetrahymena malaccensis]